MKKPVTTARRAARRKRREDMTVVAKDIEQAVHEVAADPEVPSITEANAPEVAEAITEKIEAVVTNATNNESPLQSRVLWGATIGSIATIVPLAFGTWNGTVDWSTLLSSESEILRIGGALVALAGMGYTFYGRLVKGLKPLFWRA